MRRGFVLAVLVGLGHALSLAAEPPASLAIESPRLVRLAEEIAGDRDGSLARFRVERSVAGGPLVEELADDPGRRLVTFLWFEDPAAPQLQRVVQESVLEGREVTKRALSRLADSALWYRSYRVPNQLRLSYLLSPDDARLGPDGAVVSDDEDPSTWRVDPLNPRRERGEQNLEWSVLELPGSTRPPGDDDPPRREPAAVELRIASAGLGREVTTRAFRISRSDAAPSPDVPLLLFFDAFGFVEIDRTPRMLQKMVEDGSLPEHVAAFVATDGPSRNREVSCNPAMESFLASELLPKLRAELGAGRAARRTILVGRSRSGLGAVCAALRAPALFGGAIAQSGAFWWSPAGEETEWLARWIAAEPRADVALHLEAGVLESSPNPATGLAMLTVTRHLRDVARARGYRVSYREFAGGHDPAAWRSTLPDALIALLGASN